MSDHDDEDEQQPSSTFLTKFKAYQSFVTQAGGKAVVASSSGLQIKKHSERSRTKVTPLIKEKKPKQSSSSCAEVFLNDRVCEVLTDMVDVVCSFRPRCNRQDLFEYAESFALEYRVKFPKSKEKLSLTVLYCIILGARLRGVFLDCRLLSVHLSLPYKNIVTVMNENFPPITSDDPRHNRVVELLIDTPRHAMIPEYVETIQRLLPQFDSKLSLSDKDAVEYESVVREIFSTLEKDIDCEYERQFCVTPDKVYIYGIFEIIRMKSKGTTERAICDFLSSQFLIPRVTIEKMKRLVTRSRS